MMFYLASFLVIAFFSLCSRYGAHRQTTEIDLGLIMCLTVHTANSNDVAGVRRGVQWVTYPAESVFLFQRGITKMNHAEKHFSIHKRKEIGEKKSLLIRAS